MILVNNENEYEFAIKLSQFKGISWMVGMALRVIFHSFFLNLLALGGDKQTAGVRKQQYLDSREVGWRVSLLSCC